MDLFVCLFAQLQEQQGVIQRFQRQLDRLGRDRDVGGASSLDAELDIPKIKVRMYVAYSRTSG